MKFSERTLTILKSFSTINKSILMKQGNTLRTITPEKTLIASATIPDQFPSEACIYDLSRFLSILSLHTAPDVEFHDKYFVITEGKQRTRYAFADVSMIHAAPEKTIELPSADVVVDVSWNDLQSVQKAAGVLQFNEVAFVGQDGKCYLKAIDSSSAAADDYGVEIGDTADTNQQSDIEGKIPRLRAVTAPAGAQLIAGNSHGDARRERQQCDDQFS